MPAEFNARQEEGCGDRSVGRGDGQRAMSLDQVASMQNRPRVDVDQTVNVGGIIYMSAGADEGSPAAESSGNFDEHPQSAVAIPNWQVSFRIHKDSVDGPR